MIKTTLRTFLKTSEPEETIQHNIFFKKLDFTQVCEEMTFVFLNFAQILLTSTILTYDWWVTLLGSVLTFDQSFC